MLIRYFFVGGVAACFDLGFFYYFSSVLGFNYLFVGGVGFVFATAINYIISIRIVFTSGVRFSKKREIAAVFLISGTGLCIHEIVLYLAVTRFGLLGIFAKVIASGSVFFWNYYMRKWFVFTPRVIQ
jgi:putative flippase GtrA